MSRKTDYALIALGYLAERAGQTVSARDVARGQGLPLALLMNILKRLQKHKILRSTRGVRGGYCVAADLENVSLHELIRVLEGKVEPGCDHESGEPAAARRGSAEAPIQALHYKLMQFLHDVSLADLVLPGRRIDVPAESLRKHKARPASREVTESLVPVMV